MMRSCAKCEADYVGSRCTECGFVTETDASKIKVRSCARCEADYYGFQCIECGFFPEVHTDPDWIIELDRGDVK